MLFLETANEIMMQAAGFASVSLGDVLGSAFMRIVLFFVDLILGL